MATNEARILSIQSHVVSGYVGNKSACFPLQVLGFEVDTINSVQLCNHTGYQSVQGQILNADDIDILISGLKENKIDRYSFLLTGYIGSKSFLHSVKQAVLHFKKINPELIYVCDPVMGDNGKMYVPEDLLEVYKNDIVPLADILTPNQFEAELLSGIPIKTVSDAVAVADWFHARGVKIVVLSSTELDSGSSLICIASSSIDKTGNIKIKIAIPKLPTNFTGSGDLFTSLLTAWLHKTSYDLKTSIENVVSTMQKVLTRTFKYAKAKNPTLSADELITFPPEDIELKIVQSLDDIRNPKVSIEASLLN